MNKSILKFFAIYFGFTVTSNFVHAVTPAFLEMTVIFFATMNAE